jgi:hypothetical protein
MIDRDVRTELGTILLAMNTLGAKFPLLGKYIIRSPSSGSSNSHLFSLGAFCRVLFRETPKETCRASPGLIWPASTVPIHIFANIFFFRRTFVLDSFELRCGWTDKIHCCTIGHGPNVRADLVQFLSLDGHIATPY